MRLLPFIAVAAGLAVASAGCGGSSTEVGSRYVRYHEPSQGWTTNVPAGWTSVLVGPAFLRGNPLHDPTRLLVRTYRNSTPAAALRRLSTDDGITVTEHLGRWTSEALQWQHLAGRQESAPRLAVDLAVARDGADTQLEALVARRAELEHLRQTTLLPAVQSFVPGPPDPPRSVLAGAPPRPWYWPTAGWRSAPAGSQGMDGARLRAMVAEIRTLRMPIDSVTVIRHGRVVLDASFGRFASGRLGEPYASGRLHELQSATKSITSMLLGIAMREASATGTTVKTPVVQLAAAVNDVPKNTDTRKRAIRIEDLLTMQSGIAWKESGYAYEPGSGNDVMAMLATSNWAKYVVDRPMAAPPGTTFAYDSGTSHLVSALVTLLTHRTAGALAESRLFTPLGIHETRWLLAPEGINAGGFGLQLRPHDLAKLAFLYLHHGSWKGRQIVPTDWVKRSTTDQVADPLHEYGYLWWLDRADGYAYMAGLYGQLAAVDPEKDIVAVITAHLPATVDATAVTRWLFEKYILSSPR